MYNPETRPDNPMQLRVLVVIMNNQRDWRMVQEQGWYRIPLAHAPQQLAADWLAFYHTKAFAQERWSIRYYAAVRRIRLAQREQLLPEESAHPRAHELYYKIELGPLHELPHPIPSAHMRRITFIPTTLARLQSASDVRELWEGRTTAEQLWEALQAVGVPAHPHYVVREKTANYQVDLAIFCRGAKLAISCHGRTNAETARQLGMHGWRWVHYETRALSNPWRCARQILQHVHSCGGLPEPDLLANEKEL